MSYPPSREEFLADENLIRLRIQAEGASPNGSVSIWSRNLLFLLDEIKRLQKKAGER